MTRDNILGAFRVAPSARLFLASASPRRRDLLASSGLDFEVLEAGGSEPLPQTGEAASEYAIRAALAKGSAALEKLDPEAGNAQIFVAADTVVCIANSILGKPRDMGHAMEMLRRLNGRAHTVYTGVAVICRKAASTRVRKFFEASRVEFAAWPNEALAAYVASGEAADKAGAYAIQGRGAFLVNAIEGSWTNVVGLPLAALLQLLLAEGWIIPQE